MTSTWLSVMVVAVDGVTLWDANDTGGAVAGTSACIDDLICRDGDPCFFGDNSFSWSWGVEGRLLSWLSILKFCNQRLKKKKKLIHFIYIYPINIKHKLRKFGYTAVLF